MKLVRTNVPGWSKDEDTGAILNTNVGQVEMLKAARVKNREMKALENEVKALRAVLNRVCKHLGLENYE
jgi:hypothetical protein